MPLLFHAVIFMGSFLLFQIQPMAAKQLLPLYGGSAAVWSACMLFFQVLLLLGYAYSHGIQRLNALHQLILHGLLLVLVVLFLPDAPASTSAPGSQPVWSLLLALGSTIGASFFLLSTTSPLVQSWAVRYSLPDPYRLYTTSNIASLSALLSYPFIFEPLISLNDQFSIWKWFFCCFCLICLICNVLVSQKAAIPASRDQKATAGPTSPRSTQLLWILWPALGSVLLLGFTSHICRDIAVVPFLWILPLSIYLLSFILCFSGKVFYRRILFCYLFLASAVLYSIPWTGGVLAPALIGITVNSTALFLGVMIAHGELVRHKPDGHQLTRFYLFMSLGGALGGVFVALLAPVLFKSYFELPLAMSILATACLVWLLKIHLPPLPVRYALMLSQATIVAFAFVPAFLGQNSVLFQSRNFYGVIKVREEKGMMALTDGRIEHGNMYLDPALQHQASGYYAKHSGIGQALASFPEHSGRRIGVIGVGAGGVCAYARPGDDWWLFELNPDVRIAATRHFKFLEKIPDPYHFLIGDGRLQLMQSQARDFDLIFLDAFSSDSIPVHLLTKEAFLLYLERLKPEGLIVVHITNGHINFNPLVALIAAELDLHIRVVESVGNGKEIYSSSYAVFSRSAWNPVVLDGSTSSTPKIKPGIRLWTDNYSNLFQLMNHP